MRDRHYAVIYISSVSLPDDIEPCYSKRSLHLDLSIPAMVSLVEACGFEVGLVRGNDIFVAVDPPKDNCWVDDVTPRLRKRGVVAQFQGFAHPRSHISTLTTEDVTVEVARDEQEITSRRKRFFQQWTASNE